MGRCPVHHGTSKILHIAQFFTQAPISRIVLGQPLGVMGLLYVLSPMLAIAQSQQTSPPFGGSCTPDIAIDSALTNSLELRLLKLNADLADIEVKQTGFLHTLIPRVSVSARFGQRSILFLDPTHPWSFPSDAFSAVISLDLDRIINPIPHQQALIKADQSRILVQKRKSELRQELITLRTQIEIMDSLIASLEMKREYKKKLVKSAEVKYQSAKISFEELVRAKLDLADTEYEISTQKTRLSDLDLRLSTLMRPASTRSLDETPRNFR